MINLTNYHEKIRFRLPATVICCLLGLLCLTGKTQAADYMLVFAKVPDVGADTTPIHDTDPEANYRLNGDYLRSYPRDLKRVLLRPASWNKQDLKRASLVVAGTGLLLLGDREINRFVARNQTTAVGEITTVIEPFGNTYPPLILTGLYLTGLITKNRKLEHASLATAKSLGVSTVIYIAVKSVIRRQRPFRTGNPYNFAAPFSQKGYNSFPSGHTNTVFCVATAMSLEYRHVTWVPYVSYSIATITALSRLYQNRHWASDVFFGAALSHFVTKAVYNRMTPKVKEKMPVP
ncbi:MAG: phosphatase PAP2 family protein [Chitinophagaceae bacterium]